MSDTDDLKPGDSHTDRVLRNEDRIDWYGKRKTFAEEADEIIEETKIEIARAVRKVFESPD